METTTITDILYLADGVAAPLGSTIKISWPRFTSVTNRTVPAGFTVVNVAADGSFSVELEPTDTATPAFSYTVQYSVPGVASFGTPYTEYWDVPTSETPLIIEQIAVVNGSNTPPVVRLLHKGDIGVFDGTVTRAFSVGTDGQVLMADSTQATGVRWGSGGGGGGGAVDSVFGRAGVVTAQAADYSSFYDAAGSASAVEAASLQKTANLSDVASASTARTNLGLAPVAASGAYADLTGKPTIPVNNNQLVNGAGYIVASDAPVQSVNGQTGVVALTIPSKTSQLTNDSAFVNEAGAAAAAPVQSVNGATGAVVIPLSNQTVEANGTPATQRAKLNLAAGANVTITASDNGTDTTTITVASAGGGGSSNPPGGATNAVQYSGGSAFDGVINATATKQFLTQANSAAPTFAAIQGADVPAINLAATGPGGVTGSLPYTSISGAPPGTSSIVTKSTAYTATTSDYTILCDAAAAAFTVTLPPAPTTGQILNIKKIDSSAHAVTISGNGKNIDGSATGLLSQQYASAQLQFDGTAWWVL